MSDGSSELQVIDSEENFRPRRPIIDRLAQEISMLYDTGDVDIDEIVDTYDLDILSVKVALKTYSKKYRQALDEKTQDITVDEYQQILSTYKRLILTTEDGHLKEKGLRFLINEYKGRNDRQSAKKPKVVDNKISIAQFNSVIKNINK